MRNIISIFCHFFYLGCISFGGPAAHLGYFQRYFIEKHQWLDVQAYSRMVALSQFLPGPASSQVGFSIGYSKGGLFGAIAAFLGFTLPSFVLLYMFAVIGVHYAESSTFVGAVYGLKLLAVVVVADAVLSMSKVFCKSLITKAIAMLATLVMVIMGNLVLQLFVLVIAGIAGLVLLKSSEPTNQQANNSANEADSYKQKIGWLPLVLFLLCLLVLPLLADDNHVITLFNSFYQAGAFVFGGGHVVLPLLQQTIEPALANDTFILGYASAQAVPGPMFTIATFLGANILTESPLLGATVATLGIFLPGFLLVLALQGVWQKFAFHSKVSNFISGVNAAVVGLLAAAFYNPIAINAIFTIWDVTAVIGGYLLMKVFRLPILALVVYFIAVGLLMIMKIDKAVISSHVILI